MPTRPIRTFTVLPHLPERLQALQKLAYNLWWCWNPEAVALFRRIDAESFEALDHNPVKLLSKVDQARLEELLDDDGFLAHLDRVEVVFDIYMNASTWYQEKLASGSWRGGSHARGNGTAAHAPARQPVVLSPTQYIAHFSAEFGLNESIPVYSGGLGVLAGDHLKAASDLGIPLVGVGLMYREGYFRQYLNIDGWQQERYPENDFFHLPLIPESKDDGSPLLVSIPFPGRDVQARIWRIQVGRVPLYLLDTNIPQNSAEDRQITGRLYGGDHDMRIRQEIVLGIGGVRALRALGKPPTVCHMNEGHSAFCGLERIRLLMEEYHLDFAAAREAVTAGTVFTTHTPVPAGNDVFSPHLVEQYFGHLLPQFRISMHDLLGLGRQNPNDHSEPFCMTVLAIRLANVSNGVSALHGKVSRKMWKAIWPDLPEAEVPITHVTNGVHTPSWVSPDLTQLYDRYLGPQWSERPAEQEVWKRVENIPDAELWRTHERRRERLVAFARDRLKRQLTQRGAPPAEIARADEALDPEALTIGFARRFATYKRGTLLFRNLDRLTAMITSKERPVQIIFSGKAHPRDHGGKELIAEILHVGRRPEFRRRIVFLEDYDIGVARYMVQGIDIWLNNPRRPLEASGTSGMKAACNGGLNVSVLDGWWEEGYDRTNGWAIGAGEEYTDLTYQDDVESRAIYDLLEQEIIPLFYTRSSDGLPRGWLKRMKRSILTIGPVFSTGRMVAEYMERCYAPSIARYEALAQGGLSKASALAKWRQAVYRSWSNVRVEGVEANGADPMHVGSALEVTARVNLGPLGPDDVEVQLFHGLVDSLGDIPAPATVSMSHNGARAKKDGNVWIFHGTIPCRTSGQHGYAVRVLPRHPDLPHPFEPGLVCWG
ncbi:MAG: alpha-glucan family phosphorylase [Planctomycetes bacterium]|nr:alpha-glucan family phosphorylase [Planctomycetota bacterium]